MSGIGAVAMKTSKDQGFYVLKFPVAIKKTIKFLEVK